MKESVIEVGKGSLGYYIIEKSWTVHECLTRDNCIAKLKKIHKKYPDKEIKVGTGGCHKEDDIRNIINESIFE